MPRRNCRLILLLAALSAVLAAGCATVAPHEDFARLGRELKLPKGPDLIWKQDAKDEAKVKALVEQALAGGLTQEEAVAVALWHNRALQAAFEELGVSKAELVQAGLFENPRLGALVRFPVKGEESATNIEMAASFKASDLWLVPLRQDLAEASLQRVTLEVAEAVVNTRHQAKAAFIKVYFCQEIISRQKELLRAVQDIVAAARRRHEFGYMTELEVYLAEEAEAEAAIALKEAEMELSQARAGLVRVLGLDESADQSLKLAGGAGPLPSSLPQAKELLAAALTGRLDVRIKKAWIAQARRGLNLEKARLVRDVRLGANWERDASGSQVLGPEFEFELPVFDQNQAQIARAEHMVRRAEKSLSALEGAVREQIMQDTAKIGFLRFKLRQLQDKILPLKNKALAYGQKWAGLMQVDRVLMLQTKRDLFTARFTQTRTLLEFHQAMNDLEYHLGGRLP